MLTYAAALDAVISTLAAEGGCAPADITSDRVQLFSKPNGPRPQLARRYWTNELTFAAVSLGRGATLTASAAIADDVAAIFRGADRDRVFEPGRLAAAAALLAPHGRTVYGPYPRLLCGADTWQTREAPAGCRVTVEPSPADERLEELDPSRWPNAISSRRSVPTAALAVARCDGAVAGLAATSIDTDVLWQIGIDVAEPFRGRGIGAALTSALARHILDAGGAPFYGAAPANVPSIGTALAAGFRLTWVEAFSAPAGRY